MMDIQVKSARRGGKKNRKFSRTIKSPSHQRYNNERRWVKNKARRVVKQLKKFPNYKPYNLNAEVVAMVDKMFKG